MIVHFTGLIFLLSFLDKNIAQFSKKNISLEKVLQSMIKPKIINGEPAVLGEIPYQVSMKYMLFGMREYSSFCGGSIIKPKLVVSAAHCFLEEDDFFLTSCNGRIPLRHYRTTYVVAGNLKNKAKRTTDGQWRRIGFIAFPSTYHKQIDDISIVHLTKPFTFNDYVGPINYARNDKDYAGLSCATSGYGFTERKVESEILLKVNLEVLSNELCAKADPDEKQTKRFCSSSKTTGTNPGDSGGPVVCKNTGDPAEDSKGVLAGIVSSGIQQHGIHTRVSSYANYIARGKADINLSTAKLQYVLFLIWIFM